MGVKLGANQDIERRTLTLDEIRVIRKEGEPAKIIGHAAVFEKLSEDLGGFREKIAAGAFKKTIQEADVRGLFNHDANYVLGRNKAGTLTLSEDQRGLAIEALPPDTQWARDLTVSMDRGDITQMSFGFQTVRDIWEEEMGKTPIRTLQEVKLFDVSVVTFPAYPQTSVKVRDYVAALAERSTEPGQAPHSEEKPVEPDWKLAHSYRERELQLAAASL
jgi:hypothetical protein